MEEVKKIPFAKPFFGGPLGREQIAKRIELHLAMVEEHDARSSNGENCRKLEEQVAKISGADYGISCSSCTQAMTVMLGASAGRKIRRCMTQSFTWDSTVIASNIQGYELMALDVDYDSWSVKHYPQNSQPTIALAVDTFGNDDNPTSDVSIFYDRAHSLGVKFRQLGMMSAISFSRSKIITAEEGGMILTNIKRHVPANEKARDLMSRMPEMDAIMALHNLRYLDELLGWKKDCYNAYKLAFPGFQFQECKNTNHQVIGMLVDSHEQQQAIMANPDVEFKAYYEPMHLKYKGNIKLPVTEDIARRIICLPSWYKVDRQKVIETVKKVIEK